MKNLLILLSLFGVSFLIYRFRGQIFPGQKKPLQPGTVPEQDEYTRNLITNAKYIYSVLVTEGLHPATIAKYATSMAAHETGGFTSNIWKENKNAFGYKYVGQKLAVGENRGHAVYRTIKDSAMEFVDYWNRRRIRLSLPIIGLSGFVNYLKNPNIKPGAYFEAPASEYLRGTTFFYNQIFG